MNLSFFRLRTEKGAGSGDLPAAGKRLKLWEPVGDRLKLAGSGNPSRRNNLLVVDDDQVFLKAMSMFLTAAGITPSGPPWTFPKRSLW